MEFQWTAHFISPQKEWFIRRWRPSPFSVLASENTAWRYIVLIPVINEVRWLYCKIIIYAEWENKFSREKVKWKGTEQNMFLQSKEWDRRVERLHKGMQSNYKHYFLSDIISRIEFHTTLIRDLQIQQKKGKHR